VALFVLNLGIETLLLPWLELESTAKNDGYFIGWWLLVLGWLLFGIAIIEKYFSLQSTRSSGEDL
jgi:hypothetical protein